jgi:hypothetical protein
MTCVDIFTAWKMTVFWDVLPFSFKKLTDGSEVHTASSISVVMRKRDKVNTSEMSVNFCDTTW